MAGLVYQFADFRLDCGSFELLRKGSALRMERKPMELLILLVSRQGQLVSRAEIAQHLWSSEVFVDTEHGINTAVRKVRYVLRDDPEEPRILQTVTGKGYRIVCPIEISARGLPGLTDPPSVLPTGDVKPGLLAVTNNRRLGWLLSAFVMAALLLAGVWHMQTHRHPADPIHSLAVLPFENLSGDGDQEYFAEGMTDELITEMARIPTLRVVSRTSIMQEKDLRKPLRQIARELSVDAVVEGSVARSGDRVRITAQLIDVRDDKHLWAQSFESQLSDVVSLEDSVAREIALQTKAVLIPTVHMSVGENMHIHPEAHDAYLRGIYFLQRREADKSSGYFRTAISIEPAYAQALAGLAEALHMEWVGGGSAGVMEEALAVAKRAIQLDPSSGEAYAALGGIESDYEWNWEAAERDLQRGIALSPSYSRAEFEYAILLDTMNRPEDAVTHMRRAYDLDPISFLMNRHLGSSLYYAHRYDEALRYLQQARELEPGKLNVVDNWISWIYEKKGMLNEAVNADLSVFHIDRPKVNVDNLHSIYKREGWEAYWRARIGAMQPYADERCVAYYMGVSYLRIGDRDHAFSKLNTAVDQRCTWILAMREDPLLDGIRKDRRYDDLVRRIFRSK